MAHQPREFAGPPGFLYTPRVVTIRSHLTSGDAGYPAAAALDFIPQLKQPASPFFVRSIYTFQEDVAITGVHLCSSVWSAVGEILGVGVGIWRDKNPVRVNGCSQVLIAHSRFIQDPGSPPAVPLVPLVSSIQFNRDEAFRVLTNQSVSFFWTYAVSGGGETWQMDAIAQVFYVPLAYGVAPGSVP